MQLNDYFEFLGPDDIRIKGHRIGIDDVLYYYLEGYTPEEIAANLPTFSRLHFCSRRICNPPLGRWIANPAGAICDLLTLSLEQIHATITYYLHNRAEVDAYLSRLADWREQRYREWEANPPLVVQRLRALKAQRAEEQVAVA